MNMLLPKWCFNGVIYQCAIKENTWLSFLWRPGEAWNGRVWVQQCSFCWRAGVELCPLGMAWLLPSKSEYLWLTTPLARLDPVTFCSAGEGDSQGSKWVVTRRIRGLPRPRLQQGHGWITWADFSCAVKLPVSCLCFYVTLYPWSYKYPQSNSLAHQGGLEWSFGTCWGWVGVCSSLLE